MRQTEVYEWFTYGLAENMFCVSDTRNKMKKRPKIVAGMYEVNRERCVGVCAARMCVFSPPFFLALCVCGGGVIFGFRFVLFLFFLYFLVDICFTLMLN